MNDEGRKEGARVKRIIAKEIQIEKDQKYIRSNCRLKPKLSSVRN